jgi:excinuclease ABC subunit C
MGIQMQNKDIPQTPGVYFFSAPGGSASGGKNKIIYVGKAINLRARLRSYFLDTGLAPKTIALMKEATALDWKLCDSEADALIQESEYIKKYHPKFNILMRDDKQYGYVVFTKEAFPRIIITHQLPTYYQNYKLKTTNYTRDCVGPFTEIGGLRTILKMLRRAFPYCTCRSPHAGRCLNSKIGLCFGFCCEKNAQHSKVDAGTYKKNISAIKKILEGKNTSILRALEKEMKTLSDKHHYEEAARTRDQIYALKKIFEHRPIVRRELGTDRQKALHALAQLLETPTVGRVEAYDISNIHGKYAYGSMVVFVDGLPQTDQYRIFKIKTVPESDDPRMMHETISRRLVHPEWPYPDVMVIDGGPTQLKFALIAWSQSEKAPNLKIISLAKREEELYLSPRQKPINLKASSESLFQMLTHIRNEAHRFGIKHYRKAHTKKLLS